MNKLEILEDRLTKITNTLGEIDFNAFNMKTGSGTVLSKERIKNIVEALAYIQRELNDNDSLTFKEVNKKCN